MLVHFVSGVAGGFSNRFFDLSAPGVFVVAAGMMLAWELGEWKLGVTEHWTNMLLDVAVGCAGVALALVVASRMTPRSEVIAFAITFGVALLGGIVGGLDYRRRLSTT